VHIIDADGNTVAQIDVDVESSKGGDTVVKWDGKDQESGDLLLGGKYTVEVRDIHNSKKVGYAYQDGVVTGVNFNGIGASLTVNGTQFGLSYLVSVEEAIGAKDDNADDEA
jgi:flagellar hook assembly protein FlgD